MAEIIKPKKEDIVVFGRIVSASTEGVVANAEQIYDGVSNIRQYEINKKFLSGNYTIDESNIKDKSITSVKLADNAVTTEKIAQGAIESEQIQYDAIKNEHICDDVITTDKLHDYSVVTDKLDDYSVVNNKLADNAVSTTKIADQAVLVSKIADEVWDKLKNEYLRCDGKNFMKGDLRLNDNRITGITELRDNYSTPSVIAFNKNDYDIKFEKYSTSGNDEEATPDFIGGFSGGEFDVPLNITALGFKTIDSINIGLLTNNGSVALAITDSDIDGLFQQVFQTVIG